MNKTDMPEKESDAFAKVLFIFTIAVNTAALVFTICKIYKKVKKHYITVR